MVPVAWVCPPVVCVVLPVVVFVSTRGSNLFRRADYEFVSGRIIII